MSVNISWDNNEKTIIRYTFSGKWTWEEFWSTQVEAKALSESVPHTVHAIVDLTLGQHVPGNAILHLKSAIKNRPKNRGLVVIFGGINFVSNLIEMLQRVFPDVMHKYVYVHSEAEAYQAIDQLTRKSA